MHPHGDGCVFFNLAFAINFILAASLRATGDAWSPLMVGAVVNALNIPLLYVLVVNVPYLAIRIYLWFALIDPTNTLNRFSDWARSRRNEASCAMASPSSISA